MYMKFGALDFTPAQDLPELVGAPVLTALQKHQLTEVYVSAIDASLADTAAFCEAYDIGLEVSANCVIVEAKRAERTWYAACLVLATTRADVNGAVRRYLDARKISFAPMDIATSLTGMEYGGITPIGLPPGWPILVDSNVVAAKQVIIGSGIRGSKLLIASSQLASLPGAIVMGLTKPA